jgi:hypothetical protein
MFERSTARPRRFGYGTLVIALATLVTAASMFFASAVDVKAMLRPDERAARMGPVILPQEWVWRGRAPVDIESMYTHHEPPRQDWIRMNGTE